MSAKIRAAVEAKRDSDFLLIARTDSRALENFDGAVKRAQAYVAAGADAIFPEALQTKEEFRDFAREVKVPLLANMTEFGKARCSASRNWASLVIAWSSSRRARFGFR